MSITRSGGTLILEQTNLPQEGWIMPQLCYESFWASGGDWLLSNVAKFICTPHTKVLPPWDATLQVVYTHPEYVIIIKRRVEPSKGSVWFWFSVVASTNNASPLIHWWIFLPALWIFSVLPTCSCSLKLQGHVAMTQHLWLADLRCWLLPGRDSEKGLKVRRPSSTVPICVIFRQFSVGNSRSTHS